MVEVDVKEGQKATKVRVDGEEAALHITDQAVMFEKGGNVSGFLRSAIQLVKPDGDAMVIAYSVGNQVKSVRVEPITAVTPLLVPSSRPSSSSRASQVTASTAALDDIFERLYKETSSELEERLAKVQEEPENLSLRLNDVEEKKYGPVFGQMVDIIGYKHGIDPLDFDSPVSMWGLEKQPYELQLEVIEAFYISFLHELVGRKAETADIGYTATGVWPEDWERILIRFKLKDGPFLTEKFKNYLRSKWKKPESSKKPVLASSG